MTHEILSVEQGGQAVEPFPTETEPAAGADLLAAEAQDEAAVTDLLEGESGIGKLEVGVALLMGVADGSPDGHRAGIEPGIGLAQATGEVEVGTVAREHAEGAAHDLVLVLDEEYLGKRAFGALLGEQAEELAVGEVLAQLRGVVALQHAEEGIQVLFRFGRLDVGAQLGGTVHLAQAFRFDALFGRQAVQRVVHPDPVHGEVAVVPEMLVARQGGVQIPEFDEEAVLQDLVGEVLEHLSEELVGSKAVVKVLACAEHFAPVDNGRREDTRTAADYGQQLGHRTAVH